MEVMMRIILLIMLVFLFVGCEEDSDITGPAEPERYTVTISGLPDSLNAPTGATREIPFEVVVRDYDGLPAAGMEVELSVPYGEGEIEPTTTMTDETGWLQAVYSVQVPGGESLARIRARVDGYAATKAIHLTGAGRPERILLTADAPVITIPYDQSGFIRLTATVTDNHGVGVLGLKLRFTLEPVAPRTEIFGWLTPVDPTDDEGNVEVIFHSGGGFGRLLVHCSVDEAGGYAEDVTAETPVEFRALEGQVASLTASANPSHLFVPPGEQGSAIIQAQTVDAEGNGIPNLRLICYTDVGCVESDAVTDEMGTARFNFLNNFEYGVATITVEVPGTNVMDQVTIEIIGNVYTLRLSSDRNFIYADGGLTYATLTATLKDEDGQVVRGAEIIFSSEYGVVESPAITDSLGRAFSRFSVSVPAVDSATVTAIYRPGNVQASIHIQIRGLNPINSINLVAQALHMIAGSFDSTIISATAYLLNGSPALDGTVLYLLADNGSFTEEVVIISSGFGVARSRYVAGTQIGIDTLTAFWINPATEDRIYSNKVLMPLIAGPPTRISVSADPPILNIDNPENFSTITATVLDRANNAVRTGTYVSFSTTLGTITPYSTTGDRGIAQAILSPGGEIGMAHVIATVQTPYEQISDTAKVHFISGMPSSIELTADPMDLSIMHHGINSSVLRATVRDVYGNLIFEPTTVVFELVNQPPPPHGCNINDQYPSDSTLTANGVAIASLNAGEQIGAVLVRAYTWKDSLRSDTVSTILGEIRVIGGPPFQMDIDFNRHGIDAGGGAWIVEVSARVWDIHRNPVEGRIPVVFTVDPEIANIGNGYTGNLNRNGESVEGVAFVDLVYNSIDSFDPIEISAEVQTRGGIIPGAKEAVLPLQLGELSLNVAPGNWMFEEGEEEARIRIWAVLRDGHQALINNAPVLFTTSRGRLSWYDFRRNRYEEYYPDPAISYTGVAPDSSGENGEATVYLIAEEDDIFIDPFTQETSVTIDARVVGYDAVFAAPQFVFFTRR